MDDHTQGSMVGRWVRWLAQRGVHLLPAGAPRAIYVAVGRVPGLRNIFDATLRAVIPAECKFGQAVVALNPHDPVVSGSLALGIYEPLMSRVFRERLALGQTVIDIGANVGYYTALAASMVGPQGRVLAFEPEPENFAVLQRTVQRNGFNSVSSYPLAVADRAGTVMLHCSGRNGGDHRLYHFVGAQAGLAVEAVALDNFAACQALSAVDILKIDIQGAEGLALRGMEGLMRQKVRTIFIEFYPDGLRATRVEPVAFLEKLRSYGFELQELDELAGRPIPIASDQAITARYSKGGYTNLFGERRR